MDFWSTFAGIYDIAEKINGKVYKEMVELTAELTPYNAKVIDCASGTGELALAAAVKAESVLCTDNSEKMLKTAERKCRSRGAVNIEFSRRNIFHLEEPNESFDIVIAGNVLHLLNDPEKAVRELYRIAKPGGKILLPTFMTKNVGDISKLVLKAYEKMGFSPSAEYSPKSYAEALKSFGLGTVKHKLIRGLIPCCYAVILK